MGELPRTTVCDIPSPLLYRGRAAERPEIHPQIRNSSMPAGLLAHACFAAVGCRTRALQLRTRGRS